jgi:serine/threonine-protein kinase RsbW
MQGAAKQSSLRRIRWGDANQLAKPAFHRRLPATLDSVEQLMDALEAYAEEAEIDMLVAARLNLVAEEIAANVAMHGTGATYFSLAVTPAEHALDLVLEDDGPEYDPLARDEVDTGAELEERDVGGLGVHLVRKLTQGARYERIGGTNRLSCSLMLPD